MIKTITTAKELVDFFEGYDGHAFVNVTITTNPKPLVKSRVDKVKFEDRFGTKRETLRKFSIFNCGIGYNFVNVIKTRLAKQGKTLDEYTPGKSWHVAYNNTTTIRVHQDFENQVDVPFDKLYVYLFLIANTYPKVSYFDLDTGKEFTKKQLEDYLDKDDDGPTNQGLEPEDTVKVRCVKLSSINKINIDGDEIRVRIPQEG